MAERGVRNQPLRRAAGDVLICGLESTALSKVEAAWLRLIRPAGIILFRRNLEDPAQTRSLLDAAVEAGGGGSMLRIIDAEGGTVDRLRNLVAPMPSPELAAGSGDPASFERHGRLIAREVRAFGFNTTFAPVLDLRTEASATVLPGRAVSADPKEVAEYASGFLHGLAAEGVLGCGKHFPGLGSGQVDSHLTTPQIDKDFPTLWAEDLVPYRRLSARLPMAMVSHACYPKTRSKSDPASVSRFWVSEVLKQKIGFQRLIVTDDMEMGGILGRLELAGAVQAALAAGNHLIEICHDPARILTAYEALVSEAERSAAFARLLQEAARHGRTTRRKLLHALPPFDRPSRAVAELRDEITRFSNDLAESAARSAQS